MWISNPLASALFVPATSVVVLVLGGSLTVIFVSAQLRLADLGRSTLFVRWRTWAVIAPVYGLAVLGGTAPAAVLVAGLSLQGLREYSRLVGLPGPFRRVLIALGLLPGAVALIVPHHFLTMPVILLIAATLQPILFRGCDRPVRHLAFAVLGWGYLAWLPAHLVLLVGSGSDGPGWALTIGLATALADVAAFTAGRKLGRRPLAPELSPGKTWEGAAGSLIGAAVGTALLAAVSSGLRHWLVPTVAIVIGAGAVWGDLFESALKREFGVKDVGTWLPGFGGLLDRIDSLVIVVPFVYYVLILTGVVP